MSLRLRLLGRLAGLLAKPQMARVIDPDLARGAMERGAVLAFRMPPFVAALPLVLGGRPALSVRSGPAARGALVLHLHGGAHVAGGPRTHLAMMARFARLAGLEVILPDHRLAPEHTHPAALTDSLAVWDELMARGYAPGQMVLSGDSAGGGLALALLARLCARGTPPAGLIAFSPWTDLTGSGASIRENAATDPMLPAERLDEVARLYLGTHAADDPDASPLFAAFPGCPPVLLQCSQSEILRDDSLRMAERLRGFGAEVTVQSWPDALHVWHFFDGWVPEARAALSDAARAARRMLSLPDRQ